MLVPHVHQLFNAMDPSPLRQKDLDPNVEEFIVSWGRELPRKAVLSLTVRVQQEAHEPEPGEIADAIHSFFAQRTAVNERQLRQLFRIGRISLGIAIIFLSVSIVAGEFLVSSTSGFSRAVGGTLEIGGWVAMWRPLSIFLHDWWPLAGDIRLFRRLANMPIRVAFDRPV